MKGKETDLPRAGCTTKEMKVGLKRRKIGAENPQFDSKRVDSLKLNTSSQVRNSSSPSLQSFFLKTRPADSPRTKLVRLATDKSCGNPNSMHLTQPATLTSAPQTQFNPRLTEINSTDNSVETHAHIFNNGHQGAAALVQNDSSTLDVASEEPTDTRLQENRIDAVINNNNIKKDTIHTLLDNRQDLELIESLPENKSLNSSVEKLEYDIQEFDDIKAEDLAVHRKELPSNVVAPSTQADGINGVYNEDGVWCEW